MVGFVSNFDNSNLGKTPSSTTVDPGAHFQKILAGGKQGGDGSTSNSPRAPSREMDPSNLDAEDSLPSTARSNEVMDDGADEQEV